MQDPLRIPGVLDAVRRVWEGQPDLTLPTLFGMLANRGVGWGAGDEDLLRELAALERVHPARLPLVDARVTARHLLHTAAPAHRVMVDPWRIVVRRPEVTAQPGIWNYATVRSAVVGGPLVVTSAEGIDHRLGELTRITLLDPEPTATVTTLDGLCRRELGDAVYLLRLEDDATVLLSHALDVFTAGRRELQHRRHAWEQVERCTPGVELTVRHPGGGEPLRWPAVREIILLEDSPA